MTSTQRNTGHNTASTADGRPVLTTSLIGGNVKVAGRRTSVRLEKEMWDALKAIAAIEKVTIHDLCHAVHEAKRGEESLSSAIRVFLLSYFRHAAMSRLDTKYMAKDYHGVLSSVAARMPPPEEREHAKSE